MTIHRVDSGASGDNDGTTWEHAWETIIQANGVAAGDIVLVKEGTTYTAEDGGSDACLNASGNGTMANPVIYQGDDASGGAGVGNPGYFTLDANTNGLAYAAVPKEFTIWRHCKFTGASSGGLYDGTTNLDNVVAYDCWMHDNTVYGVRADNGWTLINCKIFNNQTGIDCDAGNQFVGCEWYNNSVADIVMNNGLLFANLFNEDNNVTCVYVQDGSGLTPMINNTFDGMGDGIGIDYKNTGAIRYQLVLNNCIYDLATGMQAGTDMGGNTVTIRNNLFNSNTAPVNANNNISVGEDTQTDPPAFENEDVDYHPGSGSPLIENALDAGNIP